MSAPRRHRDLPGWLWAGGCVTSPQDLSITQES